MPQMKATKSLTYGTRRLKADDIFTARTGADARVLIALKKAKRFDGVATAKPKPAPAPKRKTAPKTKATPKPKLEAKPRAARKTKPA